MYKKIGLIFLMLSFVLTLSACGKDNTALSSDELQSSVSDTFTEVEPTGDETNTEAPESASSVDSNHAHDYKVAVTAPTCEKDGFTTYECKCGEKYTDNTVLATGHEYGDWKETKAATESSAGTAERTCKKCKDKETREVPKLIAGHTHSYTSKITKAANCTTEGTKTFTCSCGANYSETIGKTSHQYTDEVVKPTCTTAGYTKHTCSCGKIYYDGNVKANGHNYKNVVTAATCTAAGYTTHTCNACGYNYKDSDVKALGHSYKDKVVSPTCTENGYTTHTCNRCGHYYTDNKTNATGHKNLQIENKAATCSKTGYEKKVCGVCNATVSETTIPATGKHNYVAKTCVEAYNEISQYNTVWTHPDTGNWAQMSDWMVNICSQCHYAKYGKEGDVWSKYDDKTQCEVMLGYVNNLRKEVKAANPGFYNIIYDKVELVYDAKLTELANIRAKEIAQPGMYGHNMPNSTKTGASENIAKGQDTVQQAFDAWESSTGHYNIMIDTSNVRFGFGRYVRPSDGVVFNVLLVWDKYHTADDYL